MILPSTPFGGHALSRQEIQNKSVAGFLLTIIDHWKEAVTTTSLATGLQHFCFPCPNEGYGVFT